MKMSIYFWIEETCGYLLASFFNADIFLESEQTYLR